MSIFMHFDSSGVLGVSSYKELSREFYAEILKCTSGKQIINENRRIKTSAFIPWIRGGVV
tara:strand:- start:63 stop:242 length:180 start_codon:yes stop_codon:yes gene_type:complete